MYSVSFFTISLPLHIFTILSLIFQMSIGASFPFDLLHAEVVKYAQEQEEKQKVAKAEFLKVSFIILLLQVQIFS